jgi:predicted lactoylglutathione lyase
MTRKIFVNLAVDNLQRTMEFFGKLGFEFNKQFTDENAACMIINEDAYAMLLTRPFFQGFTKKAVCEAGTHTEVMLALSCESRAEVDDMVHRAIAAGGTHAMDPMDHGFMYGWSFYDLDGHHWEVVWMDPSAVQPS